MRFLLFLPLFGMLGQVNRSHPSKSAAVAGPGGLEGRKVTYQVETLENQGPLPMELEVTRHGRLVRRIAGQPFLWRWKFQRGGELVAYEAGPLHFGMTCVLEDLRTGKHVAEYDCFHEPLAGDAPAWVKKLEALP